MNVYDFDKTIFYPDSSVTFIKWETGRHPLYLFVWLPVIAWCALLYYTGLKPKEYFKDSLFRILRRIPDIDADVAEFWDGHEHMLSRWYLEQKQDTDLIISASPEFLIVPIAKRLGVSCIATKMDKRTGVIIGENCFGQEKVLRLNAERPGAVIDCFYSDSLSDAPLARLAKRAFLVTEKGTKPVPWEL